MSTYIKPLIIKHIHGWSVDNRDVLCSMCGKALHMSKGEIRLLQYYSKQQNGFRPSAKHIANTLHINKRHIYRIRDMLVKHGIAAIDENYICIDWERIRLFSILNPKLTGKYPYIKPVDIKKCHYKVYNMSHEFYDFLRFGPQENVIDVFAKMTEDEYIACREALRKRIAREKCHYKVYNMSHELKENTVST